MDDLLLIFDADCAFCQSCVRWGNRNLRAFPKAAGFQHLDLSLGPVSREQAQTSIWLVSTANSEFEPLPANRAAAFILKLEPNVFWKLFGHFIDIPGLRVISKAVYYFVAKNRAKLPGATESCELSTKVQ